MEQWRQMIHLAKMELKVSSVNLLLCWLALSFFGILLLFEIGIRLTEGNVGMQHDVIFLYLFGFGSFLFRAKHFKYHKISNHLQASPTLIMQSQLPIPKNVLMRSRFFIYLAYYLPAACIIFFVTYMVSHHLRALLSPSTYIVFVIIWFSIGFSLGIIMAASDVGDYVTTKIMILYSLLVLIVTALILFFFHKIIGISIISFTILLASDYSLLAIGLCLVSIYASLIFWPHHMKKTMQKLDYL